MIAHAAAALALILAQPAGTQGRPCITTAELGALAVVALPEIVDSFAQRCAAHLPETAFLRAGAAGFTQRLRTEGSVQREPAFAAMKRMAPPNLRNMDPQVGLNTMIGGLTGGMGARLNPKTCAEMSRFVESLSPLPAANVAMMFSSAAAFGMAMRPQQQGQGGPPICAS